MYVRPGRVLESGDLGKDEGFVGRGFVLCKSTMPWTIINQGGIVKCTRSGVGPCNLLAEYDFDDGATEC